MSGRPWLEALKGAQKEKGSDVNVPPQEPSKTLLSQGYERFESPADEPPPVVDVQTARVPRGEDERRLGMAGWKPRERCGKTIWESPDNSFYYSQEMAAHFLAEAAVTLNAKAGQMEGGNTTG